MEPDDLLDFSIRTEDGHGRLRVRGLGHVDTEFIALRYLPLFPVQSEVVVTTSVGPMARPLPRLVLRSIALAYVRRWVGLVVTAQHILEQRAGVGLVFARDEQPPAQFPLARHQRV